jgi:hypothetical protein
MSAPAAARYTSAEEWKAELHDAMKVFRSLSLQAATPTEIQLAENRVQEAMAGLEKVAEQSEARAKQSEANEAGQGNFYSSIDEIWDFDQILVQQSDVNLFENLRRDCTPSFIERRQGRDNLEGAYVLTVRAALDACGMVAKEKEKSRGSLGDTSEKKTVWPCDIFGNPRENSQIAHLVPVSSEDVSLYSDIARCVFGFQDRVPAKTIQKAIRGTSTIVSAASGCLRTIVGLLLPSRRRAPKTRRSNFVGLQHLSTNKLRLCGQTYYDDKPCLCIVPVLTVDAMKSWTGEGYEAIVLAGRFTKDGEATEASEVYRNIRLTTPTGPFASEGQIDVAREALTSMLLGMTYSLKYRSDKLKAGLPKTYKDRVDERRVAFSCEGMTTCPVEKRTNSGPRRVRLIKFQAHDATDANGHPAPDPLLLVTKAGVNWSWKQGQPMMPEPKDLEETEDYLDLLAEQEFLEYREELQAIRRNHEITSLFADGLVLRDDEKHSEIASSDESDCAL